MKTVLLLDIDATMYDTKSYKKMLGTVLAEELGYQEQDEFDKILQEIFKDTIEACSYFDPGYFVQKVYSVRKKDTSLERIDEIFFDDSLYSSRLYPDVIDFLQTLSKNENVILAVHSTGDTTHQMKKIKEIISFFKPENVHVYPDKIAEISKTLAFYKDYKIIIIDDRDDVLKAAISANNSVITVMIQREGRNKQVDSFSMVSDSLSDILALID